MLAITHGVCSLKSILTVYVHLIIMCILSLLGKAFKKVN